MRKYLLIVGGMVLLSLIVQAQPIQRNRYSTNSDDAAINGSLLTNLDGTKLQSGTISSNALDATTKSQLALGGTVPSGSNSYTGAFTGNGVSVTNISPASITTTNYTSYAAGTAYTMTGTAAQVAFGTTSPAITIGVAGTYLIQASGNLKYNAATYVATQTAILKLRRTNNTAADLSNATRTITLRVITTITDDAGDIAIPTVVYTATAGDIIQLFGSVSALPSAGSVQVDSAEIVATRLQ